MSRHQIGNFISVLYSAMRFGVLKIFSNGRIKATLIERISPNVVIDIDKKSKLILGDRVRVHSGSRITAARGGIITIGNNVRINNYCRIACRERIDIGDEAEFGPNVMIYDHDHKFNANSGVEKKEYTTSGVKIGKNTWIGANTIILRGSEIGNNCVIGAGSIIHGKYPDGVIIIQKREELVNNIE